jgi:membrane protein DedA with SNARE-associated domain
MCGGPRLVRAALVGWPTWPDATGTWVGARQLTMDTTLSGLVSDYGYFAVFVGTLLEGEAILMLAAYAAHRGHLSLPLVVAVACVGATLGDQLFFFAGRFRGPALLRRFDSIASRSERVNALLLQHSALLVIGLRFTYGLRIAGPIILGMSTLSARRFLFFNVVGALLWAPAIAGAGYLLGHVVETLIVDLKRFELYGLGVLAVLLLLIGVVSYLRGRN